MTLPIIPLTTIGQYQKHYQQDSHNSINKNNIINRKNKDKNICDRNKKKEMTIKH